MSAHGDVATGGPSVIDRRAVFVEFLGTFLLVLAGCGAVMIHALHGAPDQAGIALAFGLTVAAVVYVLGPLSGAHINPAVTIAFATRGMFPWRLVPAYVGAQVLGAVGAASVLRAVLGPAASLGATLPAVGRSEALLLEMALTAVLMGVILAVVGRPGLSRRWVAMAIGGTVGLEALWAGPLTGASMNPARSLAPALVSGRLSDLWIYLAGPVLGAALVAGLAAVGAPGVRRASPVPLPPPGLAAERSPR